MAIYIYIYIYMNKYSELYQYMTEYKYWYENIRHRAFGADGVLGLSSRRVIYAPSSLSNFSLRDLKSAGRIATPPPPDASWTSKMPPRRLQDVSCLLSFFGYFLASIFGRFLMPTWLQLASENQWKSMKNRCQDRSPSCIHFSIDFWSICIRFFDPWNLIFIENILVL